MTSDDIELGQLRRACASYVEVLAARDKEIERLREQAERDRDSINCAYSAQAARDEEIKRMREMLEVVCRWHQEFPIIREVPGDG